jgi:hypothetical protein
MALSDFYTSNENAYRNICPINLTNIDTLTSGWTPYVGKANVYYMYFANYAPKVVAEHYSAKALYGKPYTRAFDLQTLDSMIHGGFFYDTITKNLYVKCFNLVNPNTKTILLSNLQAIEAKGDSYYIHRDMRVGEHSGIKWEATIGLGERFINGDNFGTLSPFYFSCQVIDPEPEGSVLVKFPTLSPDYLGIVKFPGIGRRYWINLSFGDITNLRTFDVSGIAIGSVRYAFVSYDGSTRINATFRYDAAASTGDVKPSLSNGTGVGTGNGWWIKVWGIELEKVISTLTDIAALAALPTQTFSALSLRKVTSNNQVYKYVPEANSGNVKPSGSNGTGTPGQYNGWWIAVPSNEIDDWGYILTGYHCGITLMINGSNQLVLTAQAAQQIPVYSRILETVTNASWKLSLEIFPRTGVPNLLDYGLQLTKVTAMGGTLGTPTIYNGTITGIPSTGNFANYLTGISVAEGVIIDDLIISEIVESVV